MIVFNFFLKKKNFEIRYFKENEWERVYYMIMMLQFLNEGSWI